MSIATRELLYVTWAGIAVEHEYEAWRSRRRCYPGRISKTDKMSGLSSLMLGREFRYAMQAITSSAFSLEALRGGLADVTSAPEGHRRWGVAKKICSTIQSAYRLDNATMKRWARETKWLFGMRNRVVHFKEAWERGLSLHPSGTPASQFTCVYTHETAYRALDLLVDVLENCIVHPKTKRPTVLEWAAWGAGSTALVVEQRDAYRGQGC